MKLPTYRPQVNLPSSYHAAQPSRLALGDSAALANLAAGIQRAGEQIGEVERGVARRDEIERRRLSDLEADSLKGQFEEAVNIHRASLTTILDPDERLHAEREGVAQIQESIFGQAKHPYTTQRLQQALPELRAKYDLQALNKWQELRTDGVKASLSTTVARELRLSGSDPIDGASLDRRVATMWGAIESAKPWIGGEDAAAKLREEVRTKAYEEQAYRQLKDDPAGFLANADFYRRGAGAKAVDQMVTSAYTRIETLDRLRQAAEDKAEKKAEVAVERQRQVDLTGLSLAGSGGTLRPEQVVEARDAGLIINRTEFEHYMALAKKGPALESDPATWSIVQADVWDHSKSPSMSEGKIRDLMARAIGGGVGLSGDHGRMALAELGRRRKEGQAEGRTDDTKSRTLAKEEYNLAKEEGMRALGVTTPFAQLDDKRSRLVTAFDRALNGLVLDKDGNVKPGARQIMLDILPKFQAQQDSDARLGFEDQVKILAGLTNSTPPGKDDATFIPWFAQQHQAAMELSKNPATISQYKLRRDALLQLWRLRREMLNAEENRAAGSGTAGGGKKSGGFKPKGEK